jgi:hypothetical protein
MKEDRLLWLDLQGTDDEVLILLREVFKIHPLAVEDVKEFDQRPKIEDYDEFVSIVACGARGLGGWPRCSGGAAGSARGAEGLRAAPGKAGGSGHG